MAATLKLGASGPDVTKWQELLTKAGFPAPSTGTFDAKTLEQTKKWQASKGLTADGIVGPASWTKMTGSAPAASDPNAAFGRQVLRNVWKGVTGEEPSLAELQIAGAQAHLESNYGKSSYKLLDHKTGAVLKSSGAIHNWGAVQTSSAADGFLATDTSPAKATPDNPKGYYDHHYKVYPTPEEGAKHFVAHMTVKRPTSWKLMKRGDIDAWAEQMWAGKLPSGKLNADPVTNVLGYFEQKPSERAKGIELRVSSIAKTLGEPVAAKRGGPMPANAPGTPPVLEVPGFTTPVAPGEEQTFARRNAGPIALLVAGLAAAAYYFLRRS